ncbi:formate-dependent phosphoribosylglycinamide formyltransferase [Sphingomonas astaxanthinifaciens]|uniref:Formate-dependent phosphoribosylglycinamide formyltransferase n=1 Tax=Sphingomonas astaxanthinifaciens DSM 22298 TaxID=1123267 RepID=A0ABQ5ZB50_9SPHN|nr:formate-dependent phosphoribosylglycinamide formyltransferase [Sphingomonas astaxanthinifaciens]GLR48736.1 phosphoribosylglycinamide formyltransferase 2 [Sphingomonas astaxanthinifaciens DSM 22298]
MFLAKLMLLGSGELGREFAIAAKRLGCAVVACDRYAGAPAMQVADAAEVFSMLDGESLRAAVEKHRPDFIVPEIEAIDTATLAALESEGWHVVPSAKAAQLTMNRDGIRRFAAEELGLTTSRYRFAESEEEALAAAEHVGLPCVIKPVMSSSGKGQSTASTPDEVRSAFRYAIEKMRGDRPRVIVEEFIRFDSEITLLTVAAADGVHFCAPIGHRQEAGDYRESWQPAALAPPVLESAQRQAATIVSALGGRGLFGVEFFIAGDRAIFSELSPRPHDTGMVTLVSQEPNEFELHLRAILGLPVAPIVQRGPSASAVVLADRPSRAFAFRGVAEALAKGSPATPVDLRLFGKPETLPGRRMGVALARAASMGQAVDLAKAVAAAVAIEYEEE